MDTDEGWRISNHFPTMTQNTQSEPPETIMEYIMKQEEYISQYYTQIEFLSAPVTIYKLLKSTQKVHEVTDGGVIPLKGSIGFVFAHEDGNILLTCYCQPAGNNPLSFRSEICVFLAAVRLVTSINMYYDDILQCGEQTRSKIQLYTDSLSMMKKLEAYGKYPTAS
jgi:hypothetical protein